MEQSTTTAAMPSTQELFGDDSSDDGNEEDEQKKDSSGAPASDSKGAETLNNTGSDDDDDDAPQFNDDTVVGLKSTTIAGQKLNVPRAKERSSVDDDDFEDNQEQQEKREDKDAQPVISTQTMVVQPSPSQQIKNMYFTKLPNILGVQPEAFHPDTYSAAAEEEDYGQAAYNLIRWRYQTDSIGHVRRTSNESDDVDQQKLIRESNTRLVEWEDGSFTLHVGTEVFNIDMADSSTPQGFAGLNGYLYLSQSATFQDSAAAVTDEEGNETVPEVSAGTVLECMGPMASRMVVRPSSLQSEAHKSLTVGIRQKTIKKARIAEFVTQEDPEKLKQERIKVKDDLEKAAFRKNRGASYSGSNSSSYNRSSPGRPRMSREYLEDDRDFDTTNIKAMKRRTMGGEYDDKDDMDDYGDDSDEYSDNQEETFRKVRPGGRGNKSPAKAAKNAESDEDEVFIGEDEDDEDAPVANAKRSNKKRAHQAVVDDESD
jgi:RNA polymerase-associated protein LEO1